MTTEVEIETPLEAAFDTIAPIDLAKIFRAFGPLPAVVGTHDQTGPWDHVGASRMVELSDGSRAHEQLTAYSAPSHFAYRLDGFTGIFRVLVSEAEGAWWFWQTPRGTRVRWTYVFRPRAGRTLIVRWFIAPLWRIYQQRALAIAAHEASSRR